MTELKKPFNLELDNINLFKYKNIISCAKKKLVTEKCTISSVNLKWSIFNPFKIKAIINGFCPISQSEINFLRKKFNKNNKDLIEKRQGNIIKDDNRFKT